MSLWVLDTDIASLLLRGHPSISRNAAARARSEIALTIITVEEWLTGWYTQIRRARDDARLARAYGVLQKSVEFAARIRVLPFDLPAVQRYRNLRASKLRIGTNDLRIAAVALEHNATLVTRNQVDFGSVPNLRLEDWS